MTLGPHPYCDLDPNRLSDGNNRYTYDAEGNRVAKTSSGTVSNLYFYDVAGHKVVDTDGALNVLRTELYAGSRHLATYQGGTYYYTHANWLGTEAARSDASGNLCETSYSLPFGDALQSSGTCSPSPNFFTGKERDSESGNDKFGARYYASSMGRMMSPDPHSGILLHMLNPQRWNMYAYALDNPLLFTDPTGMDAIVVNTTSSALGLGHVGIASVHKDGTATYGEFGPVHTGMPIDKGEVNVAALKTKVLFGQDGSPTKESMTALKNELAGLKNVHAGDIRLIDYPTSDDEATNLDLFLKLADLDHEWDLYDVTGINPGARDCRSFTAEGLTNAGVKGIKTPFMLGLPPNLLFNWLLQSERPLHEEVTHKIIATPDEPTQ